MQANKIINKDYLSNKDRIYVSSLAFKEKDISEISIESIHESFNLEFSSHLPYKDVNIEIFNSHHGFKLIHNYFPPPKIPFVINLASNDHNISRRSVDHCKKNIERTAINKIPFYSAHAGFCVDPSINSLGNTIRTKDSVNRQKHLEIFIDNLNEIVDHAKTHNVQFLIENNVLSEKNFSINGQNIFLCVDSEEIKSVIEKINSPNFGLLLDTAHLKVSSNTLNLNLHSETKLLIPYIKALHHSENDGLTDTNQPFDKNYWFKPYLKLVKDCFHVIEVKSISTSVITQLIQILEDEI